MMEEPEIFLLGIPVTEEGQRAAMIEAYTPYAGAVKLVCETCYREVWVGPRQLQNKIANPNMRVVCPLCAARITAKEGGVLPLASLGNTGSSVTMFGGKKFGP